MIDHLRNLQMKLSGKYKSNHFASLKSVYAGHDA